MNNDPLDLCKSCLSVRNGLGAFSHDVTFQEEVPVNFQVLRIARSNKCDYACEMCSPEISSYYDKTLNDGKLGVIENDFDLEPYYHQVQSLAVSGGNPVLDKKLLPIINAVVNNGVLKDFIFTSNGSVFPDAFMNVFRNIHIPCSLLFSIDAHKEINEVVRKGVKQDRFYRTVNQTIESVSHNPNVSVFLEITLTRRTLPHLINLYREINVNLPIHKINVWVNLCVFPEHLSLGNLTHQEKLFLKGRLIPFFEFENNHISQSMFNALTRLINRMTNHDRSAP